MNDNNNFKDFLELGYKIPHSCEGCQLDCPSAGKGPKTSSGVSKLSSWPVKLRQAPIKADYYHNAHFLISADCAGYSYALLHDHFMSGKITLIACPKFDDFDYTKKLTEIFSSNLISSVTVVSVDIECCSTLVKIVMDAVEASDTDIPISRIKVSTDGKLL